MIVFGLISSAFDLLTFFVLLKVFDATEPVFQTAWFVVSLLTELAVLLVLRTRGWCLRSPPGRWLLWSTAGVAFFALVVPFIGPFAHIFGFVALPAHLVATIVAVVIGYIWVTELAKRRFWLAKRTSR